MGMTVIDVSQMGAREHQYAVERQSRILELLRERGRVDVSVLVDEFGVSPATVRRDLAELEGNGQLRRTHGGAVPAPNAEHDPSFEMRELVNVDEKIRIGRAVAALIQDGDNVLIDAGSTALQVARAVAGREGLTIITNSLSVCEALRDMKDGRLIVVGGEYRGQNHALVGSLAADTIRNFGIDKAVLGVSAIDLDRGVISTTSFAEAAFQKAAIEAAKEVVVVADYSKFGRSALCVISRLEEIDQVVTDVSVDDIHAETLKAYGVKVHRV